MGKVAFTPFQQSVFDYFSDTGGFQKKFYFGGGTALSVFYLQQRLSDDLNFFTDTDLDKEYIINLTNNMAQKLNFTQKMTLKNMVIWFELTKGNDHLKIDFLSLPYPAVDKKISYHGIEIDSILDIAANKLLLSTLGLETKNYVDLYFIIKEKYKVLNIIRAVEKKYKLKIDLLALGKSFLETETIEVLPKMIKPLSVNQLKAFFKSEAKFLSKEFIVE